MIDLIFHFSAAIGMFVLLVCIVGVAESEEAPSWVAAMFFPDFVAAAIPVTVSECKITSYGLRAKLFMRGVEVYPDLLASSCTPVNGVRSD